MTSHGRILIQLPVHEKRIADPSLGMGRLAPAGSAAPEPQA